MKKLLTLALATKFDNAATILQICEATSNPETAMEMLLGIYEELTLESEVMGSSAEQAIMKMTGFVPLKNPTDVVEYSYIGKQKVWAREGCESPNKDNTHWKQDSTYTVQVEIPIKGNSSCSVQTWKSFKPIFTA
jgi:hypothetical protein